MGPLSTATPTAKANADEKAKPVPPFSGHEPLHTPRRPFSETAGARLLADDDVAGVVMRVVSDAAMGMKRRGGGGGCGRGGGTAGQCEAGQC